MKEREEKKRIGVIGAGIGGLASACLLKEHDICVYEREEIPGGRALTCEINEEYENLLRRFDMRIVEKSPDLYELASGYKVDLGFHLIGGGKKGGCVKLLRNLGVNIDYIGSRLGLIGEKIEYPILRAGDKIRMLPRILQLLFTRKEKIEEMKKISMEEMIKKYGRGKLKLILEIFPRLITTVNDLSKISAGETFFAQRELLGGHPVIYPCNGLQIISKKMAEYVGLEKIKFNSNVSKIIIEDGVVKGIKIGKREVEHDIVISTIPVQKLFSIADQKEFPEDWVEYIKNLRATGSLISYHALNEINENLIGKSFVFIERNTGLEGDDVAGMIDFKLAHPEAGMAPTGKYLVQSYAICTSEEAKNREKAYMLMEIIEKNLQKLLKSNQIEWSLYAGIWHLDGVAKTIDSIKPEVTTPVKNLYIAGDCVNSKGVGMNCAADSAYLIRRAIDKEV